ncbi:MAG: hypothetical protein JXQ71_02030 [Verrucomicrobia bacterium]|nr:hypothetical protein [Verrucomicrobiota bacterium]
MKTPTQLLCATLACGASLALASSLLAQSDTPPLPEPAVVLTNAPPPDADPDEEHVVIPEPPTAPEPDDVAMPKPPDGPATAPVALGPPSLPPGVMPAATNTPAAVAAGPVTTPPAGPAAPAFTPPQFLPPDRVVADDERGLRLNFKGAPLEMVLNYLSDAAGFIIVPEVDIRGRVDVWSNQPLTKDEAVNVLNSALAKNGYAALQNGRMLMIISKETAKTRDIPVKTGNDPQKIPKSEEIITQIVPIRYISATQLIRDLTPLLPTTATLTANDAGNSLLITDSQLHIRRMVEIIKALDTPLAGVSTIHVFPLVYADAKSLAAVVKELFAPQQDNSRNNDRARFFFRGRDGGGPPGFESGNSSGGGRAPTPRVVAVADERSNSLVVSAPEEQMPLIEDVVRQVDTNVEDITELRVFRLKYADAQETADLLTSLFPDPTLSNSQSRRSRFQFGGPGMPFGRFPTSGGNTTDQSQRTLKETRVTAVPDMRTRSVVVSASRDLMPQIATMVSELDSDPAQKQKVFVYELENTDPQTVQELLESLFPTPTTSRSGTLRSSRNTSRQTGNQLNNRATQTQNQGVRRTTGTSGSFGSGFGTGTR